MQNILQYFKFEKIFIEKFNANRFDFKIKCSHEITNEDLIDKVVSINPEHKHLLVTPKTVTSFEYNKEMLRKLIIEYSVKYHKNVWVLDESTSLIYFINGINQFGYIESEYCICGNDISKIKIVTTLIHGYVLNETDLVDYFAKEFNYTGDYDGIFKFIEDKLKKENEIKKKNFNSIIVNDFFKDEKGNYHQVISKDENGVTLNSYISNFKEKTITKKTKYLNKEEKFFMQTINTDLSVNEYTYLNILLGRF